MIQSEANEKGTYYHTCVLDLVILLTGKICFLGLCISKINVILKVFNLL